MRFYTRGSPIELFNPAIPTKIFFQSRKPTVYTGQSRSRSYNFVLAHFLNIKEPFRRGMIFFTSFDPLKYTTIRREFISFHQNDDIVHFRSFQSFARITYVSYGNDFLSLNFDHGQTYRYRQVSIKEMNNKHNKCIKQKVTAIP